MPTPVLVWSGAGLETGSSEVSGSEVRSSVPLPSLMRLKIIQSQTCQGQRSNTARREEGGREGDEKGGEEGCEEAGGKTSQMGS